MQETIAAPMPADDTVELARHVKTRSGAHDHNEETANFGPSALVDRNVLVELSRLRPMALISRLVFDYSLILAAVVLCETFWHPIVYLVAIMTIGARQAGIGSVALHDGVHRMLSRNRRLNDFVGKSMSATVYASILIGYDPYRESHFSHHRTANTEKDPDIGIVDKFYQMPRWKALSLFIVSLTGLFFVLAVARYIIKNWRQNPLGVATVSATTIALSIGWYTNFYPAVLIVVYWFVPLATWGVFANQVRALAEHYPENEYQRDESFPRVFRTRDIINSWFDSFFLVTRGLNYHLAHHLCPQVPFYSLSRLQRELAKSDLYRRHAHVTHGYHRFFWEYFFQRSQAVGFLTEC